MLSYMKEIKLPLRYDSEGQYIFDRENKMILEIRGWGWIQNLNPKDIQQTQSEYQDSLGKLIVRLLNDGLLDTNNSKGGNMKTLKWVYHKSIGEWQADVEDDYPFCIMEMNGAFYLYKNNKSYADFANLSSAKKVAQLIAFG